MSASGTPEGPKAGIVATGIAGLDDVLHGGFRPQTSVLLEGSPGSGKSALGLQLIINGISKYGEPGLILSFEQFPDHLYRDAASFGWDLKQLVADNKLRVIFARRDDLFSSFAEKESTAITLITEGVIDLGAKRLLVDPASFFWQLPMPSDEQRKLFKEFIMKTKGLGLTVFLTSDLVDESTAPSEEEFVIDTILRLTHTASPFTAGRRDRTLEVVKARAQNYDDGGHPFHIADSGVVVTPFVHLDATLSMSDAETVQRCSTGVGDLDGLMGGGYHCGSTTLIAGMSGTGKTTLAAHFAGCGIGAGRKAIYVSLNERPSTLIRNMDSRGLKFSEAVADGRLKIIHATATGAPLIEFYHEVREAVEQTGAKILVLDGARELLCTTTSEREQQYYNSLFNDLAARHGITTICTYRVQEVSGLSSLANIPFTGTMDNIIYLGLVELDSLIRKVIGIFKTRGAMVDHCLRELVITQGEVRVSGMFSGMGGILQGTASGRMSEAGREILEPMVHIRDFVNNAEITTLEQAKFAIDNIRQEFNVLAEKVSAHFRGGREHD